MTSTSVFLSLGLSYIICKVGEIIPAGRLMGRSDKEADASQQRGTFHSMSDNNNNDE